MRLDAEVSVDPDVFVDSTQGAVVAVHREVSDLPRDGAELENQCSDVVEGERWPLLPDVGDREPSRGQRLDGNVGIPRGAVRRWRS